MGAVKDFMQTVNFCRHVLGMSGGDALTTPWISGIVRGAQFVCKERKQSRVLTVQEVLTLECILIDGRFSLTDRCGAGCILFLLYSRARVSDVRNVSSDFADIVEGSARAGFIEVHTFDRKSVRVTAALQIPLILVAPVFGLSDASWGKAFVQVCADIGLPLGGTWAGPLFRAPSPAGDLTGRLSRLSRSGSGLQGWWRHVPGLFRRVSQRMASKLRLYHGLRNMELVRRPDMFWAITA